MPDKCEQSLGYLELVCLAPQATGWRAGCFCSVEGGSAESFSRRGPEPWRFPSDTKGSFPGSVSSKLSVVPVAGWSSGFLNGVEMPLYFVLCDFLVKGKRCREGSRLDGMEKAGSQALQFTVVWVGLRQARGTSDHAVSPG